jgi:hypothetical protein
MEGFKNLTFTARSKKRWKVDKIEIIKREARRNWRRNY